MDAFQETLVEELGNKTAFTIPLLGGIPVAESVVVSWIVMAVLVILALALTSRLSVRNPGKIQVALESGVQFFNGFLKENLGPHWRPFVPWLGTVALYICAVQYHRHLRPDAPHQGHQRHRGAGPDEYAAHLRRAVPVQRPPGRIEEIRRAHASAASPSI